MLVVWYLAIEQAVLKDDCVNGIAAWHAFL